MYQAFDWLATAAVRRGGRPSTVSRWMLLIVAGVGLVTAVGVGSTLGTILLGAATVVALVWVMHGVYTVARDRHSRHG